MAPKLNILSCDDICTGCIKGYKKKHHLEKGETFDIGCSGIPKEYINNDMKAALTEDNYLSMLSMIDPVTWAAEVLDWHCSDPDGSIWKRKTAEGSLGDVTPYKDEYEEMVKKGQSAFNRPYQIEMMRCSSRRKVFRIGRQSGKSEVLVVAILHAIFTHKNFKVVVITPYQTQVDLVFKKIEKLIMSRPTTANSLKRFVKAPNYTLELFNGSIVKGFTAGTRSAGDANAVRGQGANMLIFDEADYLSSGDMASALSIITNYPDATVWMSSTPAGKRERFYETCKSKDYKEFHFPSSVNPLWEIAGLEKFYRGQLTDIQYTHEILAEFGEQEQGVYQQTYIEEALTDYKYEEMKPESGWMYTIGVDWNDFKVGSTIAIMGFNPLKNKFRLFSREIISKEGWTQMAACQRIVELNRIWQPQWIYIDKGFGHMQHEIITKFGHDALISFNKLKTVAESKEINKLKIDGRLQNIVKQYDFGSKVKVRDPFTKLEVDKPAKPFLIENSVRRFEQRSIEISKYDDQMQAELRGYIIDHLTPTGSPVYAQGDALVGDHNLDALNLSLVAFTLEETEFGKVFYDTKIGFSDTFGKLSPDPNSIPSIPVMKKKEDKPETTQPTSRVADLMRPGYQNRPSGVTSSPTDGKPLWSWPGFERDAPRPNGRSSPLTQIGRFNRPSRKKI